MKAIPLKIRKQIEETPIYKTCALYGWHGHVCSGRITMDHSIIFGGGQLQELWAITPVCAYGHGVDGFKDNPINHELRYWVALNRATDGELSAISKAVNYQREKARLNEKWGVWTHKIPDPMPAIRGDILKNGYIGKCEITTDPVLVAEPKKFWYTPSPQSKQIMEKLVQASAEIEGVKVTFKTVIENALKRDYDELMASLKEHDPEKYRRLNI